MGVWQEYFEELLNGGKEGVEEVHGGRVMFGNEGNGLLGEDITREEVVWALCGSQSEGNRWEGWDYCGIDK